MRLRYKWKALSFFVSFLHFCTLSKASVANQNVIEASSELFNKENLINGIESAKTRLENGNGKLLLDERSDQGNGPEINSYGEDSIGFAAEWEYIGPAFDEDSDTSQPQIGLLDPKQWHEETTTPFPSRRFAPGTWLDTKGNWWLFGGQGPTTMMSPYDKLKEAHALSDLWVYSADKTFEAFPPALSKQNSWKLVFRPETNSEAPYSSFPENLEFPLLCGSERSNHIALYGSHKSNPRASSENHNSPFSEDNVVWLYDIPKAPKEKVIIAASQEQRRDGSKPKQTKKSGCNWSSSSFSQESCNGTSEIHQQEEKQGLWTSYVCCDACLPDGNTTFEFCPQFSRDPISWCSQDSIMMLQLVIATPRDDYKGKEEKVERSSSSSYATSTTTFTTGSFVDKRKSGLYALDEGIDNGDDIDEEKEEKLTQHMTATTIQKVAKAFKDTDTVTSAFLGLEKHEIMRKNESIQSRMNLSTNAGREAGENNVPNAGESSISPGSLNSASNRRRNFDFLMEEDEESQTAVGQGEKEMPMVKLTDSGENPYPTTKVQKVKRNGRDVIQDVETKKKNIIASRTGPKSDKTGETSKGGQTGSSLNWWKFDLVSTEWIKMPEVNIEGELTEQVRNGDCRAVVSERSQLVYILCPTNGNLLDRVVLLFDPKKTSVRLLGTIHLNNAFSDKKVWQLGRSVLHALHCDNQTIIFLAYHKLLDLWIHNHASNRLYSVENVWKGSSLHTFQKLASFYKLSISLPIPSSDKDISRNGPESVESKQRDEHQNGPKRNGDNMKEKTHTTHSFFMVNPRLKMANYDDAFPQAHFHITIVPDKEVFLPPRDATYLISSTEFQSDDKSLILDSSQKDKQEFVEKTKTYSYNGSKPDSKKQIRDDSLSSRSPGLLKKAERLLLNLVLSPTPSNSAYLMAKNEASLSQQTQTPPAKSNKPLYGAQKPMKEKSLSNLQSDEKLQPEESLVHEILAPLSKHNKVNPTNSGSTADGGNGSPQPTKNPNPVDASSSVAAAADFKSNDDGDHNDGIAGYSPLHSTKLTLSSSSLSTTGKPGSLEEHRRNKYRTDIRSPKRVLLSKQELLGLGHDRNVSSAKKRILGIRKASTVIPFSETRETHDGSSGGGGESDAQVHEAASSASDKIDSHGEFQATGRVPNETVVMTENRDMSTIITSLTGNRTSDQVQIPYISSASSSKNLPNFTNPSQNGHFRVGGINSHSGNGTNQPNIHELSKTTGSNRNGESTRNNTAHFNGEMLAKSHDGSELAAAEVSSAREKTRSSSKAARKMEETMKSNEENNESDKTPTPTKPSSNGVVSELENSRVLRQKQQKQKQLFPAALKKTPVLTSKLGMISRENHQKLMNADRVRGSKGSGIIIKERNNGNVLDSSSGSSSNGEATMNFTRSDLANVGASERNAASITNRGTTTRTTNRSAFGSEIPLSIISTKPSSTETVVVAASSSPPAGLLPFTSLAERLNSSQEKEASSVLPTDDDDHAQVSDVNFNQPQHQQHEHFRNGGESLNNGSVQQQQPSSFSRNNSEEIDQLHPSASADVELAKSTFSTWTQPNNLSRSLQGSRSTSKSSNSNANITDATKRKGLPQDYFEIPEKRTTQALQEEVDDDASSSAAAVSNHDRSRESSSSSSSTNTNLYPSTGTGAAKSFPQTNVDDDDVEEIKKIQSDQSPPSHYTKSIESLSHLKEIRVENGRYKVFPSSRASTKYTQEELTLESSQSSKESLFSETESPQEVATSSYSLTTSNHNSNDRHSSGDGGGGPTAEGDIDSPLRPMTYGSSEIVVEPRDDIVPYVEEENFVGYAVSPTLFFAISLSFFASIGVVLFVRRCVKCPPRQESVLIKEPPPIRYSVIPDDLSFHTPIV